MRPLVAIQGEEGSNSAAAARALCGPDVALSFCASFSAVFEQLDEGRAAQAVLPVENTTAGLVQPVWDRLLGFEPGPPLWGRAEARVRISFVAASLPGAREQVGRVLAHPVAAAQCGRWLSASGLEVVPCHDTAGAARLVRERADPETAALCPPGAARAYDLDVIASSCGDETRTFTRFLLVEPGERPPLMSDDRALCSLFPADRPGALLEALSVFAAHRLDLRALHSRAIPGRPGAYAFLLEVEAGERAASLEAALAELAHKQARARVLGSFRAASWPDDDSPEDVDRANGPAASLAEVSS